MSDKNTAKNETASTQAKDTSSEAGTAATQNGTSSSSIAPTATTAPTEAPPVTSTAPATEDPLSSLLSFLGPGHQVHDYFGSKEFTSWKDSHIKPVSLLELHVLMMQFEK